MKFWTRLLLAFLLVLFVKLAGAQSLPDAPHVFYGDQMSSDPPKFYTIQVKPLDPVPSPFFHFRGVYRDASGRKQFDWNSPLLKPNKRSWAIFAAAHVAGALAFVTTNHRLEAVHSEVPAILGVDAMDFILFKGLSPAMGFEGGVYQAYHYIKAGR